ncbi:hypothetical protein [Nonomuraea angiospora]|uniref:hypothetical protein n=1 Tax=Nonomuraea angiospora TaxID=46172 RepID=UPI0029BD7406|nr:hypothetical protein [Nonomuraea angiospora]MDX3108778.1 hypothetical protein [Nonomuraea angiospora]
MEASLNNGEVVNAAVHPLGEDWSTLPPHWAREQAKVCNLVWLFIGDNSTAALAGMASVLELEPAAVVPLAE